MIPNLYEPFKKWAETGSVWLMGDPHFEDADCKLMSENWVTPQEQIDIINKNVLKSDTFVCLGDCGNLDWITKIKAGYKVLIKGNHDDKGDSKYTPYFNEVYAGALFIAPRILLSHEPVEGLQFCLNIHGHCHNGEYNWIDDKGGKHINLAADVNLYHPASLGKMIKNGRLSDIPTIHRLCIDNAKENPIHKD